MKMPWGKHAGTHIEDLPLTYLTWLARECADDNIREAAEEELINRKDHYENEEY